MRRVIGMAVLCVMVLALTASSVLAAEGEGEGDKGRRRVGGKERMERMERMRKMREIRGLQMPLVGSEKVRAELRRHREELGKLMKSVQELREKVKAEVDGGTAPKEAVKNNLEAAKTLAGQIIAEYTTHLENMAKLAKEEGEGSVEKLAVGLLRGPRQPPRREIRGEGGPKKDAPKEGAGDNPFND